MITCEVRNEKNVRVPANGEVLSVHFLNLFGETFPPSFNDATVTGRGFACLWQWLTDYHGKWNPLRRAHLGAPTCSHRLGCDHLLLGDLTELNRQLILHLLGVWS